MRTLRSISIAAAIALVPAALHAQGSATGTVGAVARVQSAVTFQAPARDLDFGTITPGTPVTVAPGASSGVIGVQYNTPATVTVAGLTLSGPGGATLPATLSCAQASTATAPSPTGFTCGTGFSTTLAANAATTWFIYVGGTIAGAASAAVPAGNYSGTVTLTATFSTF